LKFILSVLKENKADLRTRFIAHAQLDMCYKATSWGQRPLYDSHKTLERTAQHGSCNYPKWWHASTTKCKRNLKTCAYIPSLWQNKKLKNDREWPRQL